MCEYCENTNNLFFASKNRTNNIISAGFAIKEQNLMCSICIMSGEDVLSPIGYNAELFNTKINYCPICGRKLREVSKMTKNELLENYTMDELANMILSLKNEKAKLACELSKLKAEAKTAKKNDCLPDSPIDVARTLINATRDLTPLQNILGTDEKMIVAKYSCEELREIIGYLENYCDFNEDEDDE